MHCNAHLYILLFLKFLYVTVHIHSPRVVPTPNCSRRNAAASVRYHLAPPKRFTFELSQFLSRRRFSSLLKRHWNRVRVLSVNHDLISFQLSEFTYSFHRRQILSHDSYVLCPEIKSK